MLDIQEMDSYLKSLTENNLNFGIGYLDDACTILKNDLIIIASYTGIGKSELGSIIAMKNAKDKKNVYYFGLEAFRFEIEARNIYRMAMTDWYNDNKLSYSQRARNMQMSYQLYLNGNILPGFELYFQKAKDAAVEMSEYLNTIYRVSDYTIETFENDLKKIDMEAELIIIDHLHFFDLSDGESEYTALNKIVKKIRDLCQITEIPIILISHLRRKSSMSKAVIPSIDDLHGSSNIAKVATKIITIGPDYAHKSNEAYLFPSYMRVSKNRYNGSVTRFMGAMDYNIISSNYDYNYTLVKTNADDTKVEKVDTNKIPGWCTHAI